ncbi:MAG: hypothetical protein IBX72_04315 [Nitrospirae bacterium]|jgi:hypothetical protein|nr:hypothetical protein [Nitrospirota bacterium]
MKQNNYIVIDIAGMAISITADAYNRHHDIIRIKKSYKKFISTKEPEITFKAHSCF